MQKIHLIFMRLEMLPGYNQILENVSFKLYQTPWIFITDNSFHVKT